VVPVARLGTDGTAERAPSPISLVLNLATRFAGELWYLNRSQGVWESVAASIGLWRELLA
jgi:hypothetical protein